MNDSNAAKTILSYINDKSFMGAINEALIATPEAYILKDVFRGRAGYSNCIFFSDGSIIDYTDPSNPFEYVDYEAYNMLVLDGYKTSQRRYNKELDCYEYRDSNSGGWYYKDE